MRELERIRRTLAAADARGEQVVIATVLGVEGSVYRGTGARMVVCADGRTVGAVSGGCLEADIVARAPEVMERGLPEVVHYDTRSSQDGVLGLGLGCQGVIDILLEPLRGATLRAAVGFYGRVSTRRAPATIITLVHARPGSSDVPGSRAVLGEDGALLEGDPALVEREDDIAREVVRPAVPLVICGAGADARPLARLASDVGFHVTVVDHRPGFLSPEHFPNADALIRILAEDDAGSLDEQLPLDPQSAVVVMAHSAAHDRACLHAALRAKARYVGVLGPRRRTVELLDPSGVERELPPSVYSPAGLDLGAESPEEIALSIVAEVSAVINGRPARSLRHRNGPIHPDRARAAPTAGEHSR